VREWQKQRPISVTLGFQRFAQWDERQELLRYLLLRRERQPTRTIRLNRRQKTLKAEI
jgi:hypothetical protein